MPLHTSRFSVQADLSSNTLSDEYVVTRVFVHRYLPISMIIGKKDVTGTDGQKKTNPLLIPGSKRMRGYST